MGSGADAGPRAGTGPGSRASTSAEAGAGGGRAPVTTGEAWRQRKVAARGRCVPTRQRPTRASASQEATFGPSRFGFVRPRAVTELALTGTHGTERGPYGPQAPPPVPATAEGSALSGPSGGVRVDHETLADGRNALGCWPGEAPDWCEVTGRSSMMATLGDGTRRVGLKRFSTSVDELGRWQPARGHRGRVVQVDVRSLTAPCGPRSRS